jgi:hypothetical protein
MNTAWDEFRLLKKQYGDRFISFLYDEFTKEHKTLSYGNAGVFWLLKKTEEEALEIMSRFE